MQMQSLAVTGSAWVTWLSEGSDRLPVGVSGLDRFLFPFRSRGKVKRDLNCARRDILNLQIAGNSRNMTEAERALLS